MDTAAVVSSGVAVGMAVAMPLGPIGLMVVALGRRDWPSGVAAATGVATADLTWAAVAVTGGALVAAHPVVGGLRTIAQAALLVIGCVLIIRGLRQLHRPAPTATVAPAGRPVRYFAALYGLTLPNPLTVAIFAAAALNLGLDATQGILPQVAFAVTVGVTSLAWQLLLAATGRHLLVRAGPSVSAVLTTFAGLLLVLWPLMN